MNRLIASASPATTCTVWYADGRIGLPSFVASHAQAFDQGTIERLRRLSIAVIGASGTGSPTLEQMVRLGVGEVVIVDDDHIEDRNVNRILNSTMQDVADSKAKVDVQGDAIEHMGLGTRIIRLRKNIIRAVAQCDVVFGCLDTIDGRYLLNTLATFYNLPRASRYPARWQGQGAHSGGVRHDQLSPAGSV